MVSNFRIFQYFMCPFLTPLASKSEILRISLKFELEQRRRMEEIRTKKLSVHVELLVCLLNPLSF